MSAATWTDYLHHLGIPPAQPWESRAACRWADDEMHSWFFSDAQKDVERAKAVCGRCPVLEQCLERALPQASLVGIWGGTTTDERRARRAARAGLCPQKLHEMAEHGRPKDGGAYCLACRREGRPGARRTSALSPTTEESR